MQPRAIWRRSPIQHWQTSDPTYTTRHTRRVLSSLADITFAPSGKNPAEFTSSLCPCKVCSHSPVATFHNRIVLSALAETTFVPSSENSADLTKSEWPFKVCSHSPVATSHSRSVVS